MKRKISEVNYKLQLPETIKINPMFHVALLKPAHQDTPTKETIEVATIEGEYKVEKVLNSIINDKKVKYLIK